MFPPQVIDAIIDQMYRHNRFKKQILKKSFGISETFAIIGVREFSSHQITCLFSENLSLKSPVKLFVKSRVI